jgi:hypothetical protein
MVIIRIKNHQSDNHELLGGVHLISSNNCPNTGDNCCVPMEELVVGKVVVAGA